MARGVRNDAAVIVATIESDCKYSISRSARRGLFLRKARTYSHGLLQLDAPWGLAAPLPLTISAHFSRRVIASAVFVTSNANPICPLVIA